MASESTQQAAGTARERLLGTAARLFCRYGINAIGVDMVVQEANTAKATLYKTFGSKEGLVAAVLEREGAAWRDWFVGGLLSGEAAPAERLARIFPLLGAWFASDHFYGCPFINALGEHDKQEARYRDIALRHKRAVLDAIEQLAREAGAGDAAGIAHQLGLLIDGAIVAAMVTDDPGPAAVAGSMAAAILAPLGGAAAPGAFPEKGVSPIQ